MILLHLLCLYPGPPLSLAPTVATENDPPHRKSAGKPRLRVSFLGSDLRHQNSASSSFYNFP